MSELILCPTGCTSSAPAPNFDDCNPQIEFGEISRIFITNKDYPFTNIEDVAEWTARLSNTSTDVNAIRELVVIGQKPAAEGERMRISDGRRITMPKTHSVTAKIDELNDENYDWLRYMECNDQYLMWYKAGSYVFGGNDGISASIGANHVIPEGDKEMQTIEISAEWDAKQHPARNLYPLA